MISTLTVMTAALILWASAFAGIRAGLEHYSPSHVALLRYLTASAALAAACAFRRPRVPEPKDWLAIGASGFLGIAIYNLALNTGELTVPAGTASFIVNTAPLFTALLAVAFLGERMTAAGWIGILLGLAGVLAIALAGSGKLALDRNAILILLSAMAHAVYITLQKPLLRNYEPFTIVCWVIWSGTLPLLFFLPGLGDAIRRAPFSTTADVVYLGLGPAAMAYVCWTVFLSRVPAAQAASALYLIPVLSMAIAWFWLGEVPTVMSAVGGALALAGVIVVQRWGKKRAPNP